jgi:dTDP-4-amino-4,6-dideoxygalactose transaminase
MHERRVPLFDMSSELAPIRAELDAAIARVLDSGILIGGPEVAAFERELAPVTGAAHAVGVSSGTDALLVTLMALGIGPGDEVITTPLTFFATAGSAARLGARVLFADIDDNTLTLDPAAAAERAGTRTKAIVTVHLFGHPAAMPTVPCPVIEDAAQSIGGVRLRGLAAAFSFFPTKNLGAIGDAGAVVTNDATLAERISLLRTQGARPKYHHLEVGGNFRLDALQAAVLRAKFGHLAAWTAARRAHAARYCELFAAAKLPPELRLPAQDPAHVFHQFVIRVPRRDALRDYLAASGIGTEVYYPEPLHLQPAFAELGYRTGSLPNAERACREVLALPIRPGLAAGDQAFVVERIAAFFAGSAA